MFDLANSMSQAFRILAAPIWVLDFLLATGLGVVAWWWFKGRK